MSSQSAFGRTILSLGLGRSFIESTCLGVALLAVACGDSQGSMTTGTEAEITEEALANRAYVISEESNDLFVVDLSDMTKVGQIDTSVANAANGNHTAMVSQDGSKLYVSAASQDAIV